LEPIVSTPGTGGGKPRIAARLRLGLIGDAIDLEINAHGQLVQLKPALVGHVMAPILSKTLPNIVTLRPGMLTPIAPDRGASATVEVLAAPAAAKADVTVLEVHHTDEVDAIALTQAQIVTGIGMGLGGPEHLPTVQALARSLSATLAPTRNVVHAGWLPLYIIVHAGLLVMVLHVRHAGRKRATLPDRAASLTTIHCSIAFCWQVADHLAGLPTHFEAPLWPRAVGTVGLLQARTGMGNRTFSRWLTRDSRALFPHLGFP
jgi:hypothetical protein